MRSLSFCSQGVEASQARGLLSVVPLVCRGVNQILSGQTVFDVPDHTKRSARLQRAPDFA